MWGWSAVPTFGAVTEWMCSCGNRRTHTDEHTQDEHMQQNVTNISVPATFDCFFPLPASRWCCSLFTHNHRGTWQHMLPWSPTDMCSTLLKEKKKSRLVPELGQMFEINGNFLVFFELGQMRGKKKRKRLSFFIGWARGVLQLPLLVLLRLFPLAEQKQTLFSIVVFSSSRWEGVGGLSVGILLLWNTVGQDPWAKYLYEPGQQEEVTSQHLHLEVEPQWAVCTLFRPSCRARGIVASLASSVVTH